MKKLITFLSCFFAAMMMYQANASGVSDFGRETEAPGFFKEGRTYWYSYEYLFGSSIAEFGLKIGDKKVIDGKEWYSIDFVKGYIDNKDTEGNHTIEVLNNYSVPVANMREEDGNVYRTYSNTAYFKEELPEVVRRALYGFSGTGTVDDSSEPIFGYGVPGFQTKVDCRMGEDYGVSDATVTSAEELENSGYKYNKYTLSFKPSYGDFENPHVVVVESIGAFGPYLYGSEYPTFTGNSELIFYPFRPAAANGDTDPRLRYVTEGEDNTIIFEREGGFKLWEYQPGTGDVETVEVESNEAAQWFNLQGVEIPAPSASGIYIRKTGSKVEKVQL